MLSCITYNLFKYIPACKEITTFTKTYKIQETQGWREKNCLPYLQFCRPRHSKPRLVWIIMISKNCCSLLTFLLPNINSIAYLFQKMKQWVEMLILYSLFCLHNNSAFFRKWYLYFSARIGLYRHFIKLRDNLWQNCRVLWLSSISRWISEREKRFSYFVR